MLDAIRLAHYRAYSLVNFATYIAFLVDYIII